MHYQVIVIALFAGSPKTPKQNEGEQNGPFGLWKHRNKPKRNETKQKRPKTGDNNEVELQK
jgi:hypothetical protein